MANVICISAGQLRTKKADNLVNRRNQYLNYGLLSLASVLKRDGLAPAVVHGHFEAPSETLKTALVHGLAETEVPVLLSIPSFYAVTWAREFIAEAKTLFPKLRFIVGGRWVVGSRPDLLKELLPEVHQIVPGLSEDRVVELVTGSMGRNFAIAAGNTRRQNASSCLDYSLLHQRAQYQPSIEIARGCGMGCSFCQEKDERLQPLKSPNDLVTELQSTILRDELTEMTPYFETSMFVPNQRWTDGLRTALDQAGMSIHWRTEARVDSVKPELIPVLAASGLRVLDLGLESASATQLRRMEKTRDPEKYLERASRLLETCSLYKVQVKVNILLFAGENDETIAQTIDWLDRHRELIYGVSVSPVIVFGWPHEANAYVNTLAQFGAARDHSPCPGVTHINLSDRVTYEDSLALARVISSRFMRAERYYKLKSFSYFPRNYSFNDFLLDIAQDPGSHSFSTALLAECLEEVMGMTN